MDRNRICDYALNSRSVIMIAVETVTMRPAQKNV